MGDLDQIFINVPALPGSNVYRKDINPDMLKAWCESVEVLQDTVSQLSTRITELQTVCTYLDSRLKALEAQKDSGGEG